MIRRALPIGALLLLGVVTGCRPPEPAPESPVSVDAKIQKVQNDPKIPAQMKQGIIAGMRSAQK